MSGSMLWRLVRKDLHLNRALGVASLAIGVLALAIARLGDAAAYLAMIMLIIAVMVQAVMVCMVTVAGERKEKALLFALSFPISTRRYAAAKALGAIASALLPSGLIAVCGLVLMRFSWLPYGLVPIAAATWLFLFDQFCLILAITLYARSEALQGVAIIWISASISMFFYFMLRIPSVHGHMLAPAAVWSPALIRIMTGEAVFAALVAVIAAAYLGRRRDFL
jgi:hypothetical protein